MEATMISPGIYAPDVGYIDLSTACGEYGALGMNVHEWIAAAKDCGFVHILSGFSDGIQVNFSPDSKAGDLISLLREGNHSMNDQWTVAFGPDTLWAWCYLFKNSEDAVLARLILEN